MPPLIKIPITINESLDIQGIYDPGANISIINSRLLHWKDIPNNYQSKVRTINGVRETLGIVALKIKIFNIERLTNIFVINEENFEHDFLIGLDCVKKFKLRQNEKLEISQKQEESNKDNFQNEVEIPDCTGNILQNHNKFGNYNKVNTILREHNISKKIQINFNEQIEPNNFNIVVNNLDIKQKNEINGLIEEYKHIFAKNKYDIGTVKGYEARIDLIVDKYCCKRPYRCTVEDKKEIETQVGKLLEKNLIEDSFSPFAAPVTLAFKRDEGKRTRLCIDFRDINKIIVPESQPFPLIEDLMVKTRGCRYFTTLDINSAFWSIPLRIEDRRKTAFVTQEGHYQWTCLPFGLKTSPAIFQRILSSIIRKYKLSGFAVNYVDDILIFSTTFEDHINHIRELLDVISREGFRLKLSKCSFAQESVKYLGHIIKHDSVTPLQDNLIAIKNFSIPTKQKQVRQFIGKINFYNKYIPNFSIILDPLYNLLRKNQKFIWDEKCRSTFEKMKTLMCSKPILAIFDPNLPIHVYTDASLQGVAAVLKQIQENGEEKPVAYFSRKLNESQTKKKAIYLECLAIRDAIRYWHHLLADKFFTVFSDHKPLVKLNIKARTDEELGSLTHDLSQYNFKIVYSPGKQNIEADALSRNPVLEPSKYEESPIRTVNLISLQEIENDQSTNKKVQKNKEKLLKKNNIYFEKIRNKVKILLSEHLSIKLITEVHNQYCHLGIKQMENKIKPYYTAENLTYNIKRICDTCEICIKNKSRKKFKFGLMSHLGPATYPFEIASIDTIGGFGGKRSTKRHLHLLVDHFTRYAYILTLKSQSANDFIKLVKQIPQDKKIGMILSDQYSGINSKEFKQFLNQEGTSLVFTAVNAAFSNGLNERLNQTLVNKIRCKMNEEKNKRAWTSVAHECTKIYNETEHTVTTFSPIYLMEGKSIEILPKELRQEKTIDDLRKDRQIALENSLKSHNYNKMIFDKNREQYDLKKGDLVYVENGNKLNRRKTDELKIGPFQIIEKISNVIFKVDTGHKKTESNLFHITKLLPYVN